MTVECLFFHSAAALSTAALPRVSVDVRSKLMCALMQHPYNTLLREEDVFVQLLYRPVYW